MIENILLAFIPVFVAVDAIGVMPIFVSITEDLSIKEKTFVILQSMITALSVAIGFIFLGKFIFKVLGISVGDFMIAGGVILFFIAIIDLLFTNKQRRIPFKESGAVPLGTPLIVGPAVLTTSMMIISVYGLFATIVSIIANIILAGVIFLSSELLIKILGKVGTKVVSKIVSLFLAAIAVMMIRKGLMMIITEFKL
jgi:multiple antibiotic resistance protein